MKINSRSLTRRQFCGRTLACVAASSLLPRRIFGAEGTPDPSRRLNVACIGLGGQMGSDLREVLGCHQNIVALCDVEEGRMAGMKQAIGELAGARTYKDYRKLLESEKSVDAVLIATPDHWHAPICKAALLAGKHVFCEKPLTHAVAEARELRELARRTKVVTQTGNQGAASGNFRRSMELIQAGVLGNVREVHVWHPAHGWPSGDDRPAGADPIPQGFDWDFWVGPAPLRPYKQGIYHPAQWRGWYDFGNGSLGDFCCHGFSLPVRALQLEYPTKIEISGTGLGKESFARTCRVLYHFPAQGDRPAVKINFTSGGEMPPAEATVGMQETFGNVPGTGCLLLGEKGTLSAGLWNNECYLKMDGEPKFRGGDNHDAAKAVPVTLPRTRSHIGEWVDACLGGPKTYSDFDIGGHITEIGLAGTVALRVGHAIEWDGVKMKAQGVPEAEPIVRPVYRSGWGG